MHSLTPHAAHSHAHLGPPNHSVAAGTWTQLQKQWLIPMRKRLLSWSPERPPESPIPHGMHITLQSFFASSSHHLLAQGPNCAAPCWCPHMLVAFYTFTWPLVSRAPQFLGDCHTLLSFLAFTLWPAFIQSLYLYPHTWVTTEGLLKHPMLPGHWGASILHKPLMLIYYMYDTRVGNREHANVLWNILQLWGWYLIIPTDGGCTSFRWSHKNSNKFCILYLHSVHYQKKETDSFIFCGQAE